MSEKPLSERLKELRYDTTRLIEKGDKSKYLLERIVLVDFIIHDSKILESKLAEAEKKINIIEKLVEDWLVQIGSTIDFRQYFYYVIGVPAPEWVGGFDEDKNQCFLRWLEKARNEK